MTEAFPPGSSTRGCSDASCARRAAFSVARTRDMRTRSGSIGKILLTGSPRKGDPRGPATLRPPRQGLAALRYFLLPPELGLDPGIALSAVAFANAVSRGWRIEPADVLARRMRVGRRGRRSQRLSRRDRQHAEHRSRLLGAADVLARRRRAGRPGRRSQRLRPRGGRPLRSRAERSLSPDMDHPLRIRPIIAARKMHSGLQQED